MKVLAITYIIIYYYDNRYHFNPIHTIIIQSLVYVGDILAMLYYM